MSLVQSVIFNQRPKRKRLYGRCVPTILKGIKRNGLLQIFFSLPSHVIAAILR